MGRERGVQATKDGISLLREAMARQRRESDTPITYNEIAAEACTGTKTVQRFFRGDRIDPINATAICNFLQVDPKEVLEASEAYMDEQEDSNDNTPQVELELPEGQVPIGSSFYVERPPVETDCYTIIQRAGALIRIKAPRQMGKTSLMSRILNCAKQAGSQTVFLSLQEADKRLLQNLDQFLYWFCARIAGRLGIDEGLEQLQTGWMMTLGSKSKCRDYIEYVLSRLHSPIVLGLDEVDQLFQHPEIAGDFFGLLRAWHEESKVDPLWQKLRLVIVHSQEVYVPLDMKQSPFNVGLPIELPEFTNKQVVDLASRHGLDWAREWNDSIDYSPLRELKAMVDGHPYLVRVALYELARSRFSIRDFVDIAPTEEGPYREHLRRHLLNLQENPDLLTAMHKAVVTKGPVQVDSSVAFKLRSMGLVKSRKNSVLPLCNLYRVYFRDRLGGN